MSLRDKLRGLRGSDEGHGDPRPSGDRDNMYDGAAVDGQLSGRAELSEFAPRQDGDYHCAHRGLYLRFARPVVTETDAEVAEPARGEFTTSGRFAVQRMFYRPIVYTVLDDAPTRDAGATDGAANDVALVVRRTDTQTGTAERLEFTFEPDA